MFGTLFLSTTKQNPTNTLIWILCLLILTGRMESYLTFFERLCHHQRTHLAPANAVGTGQANLVNDILTVSHQNLIAMYWMQKIDLTLPAIVAMEYATELQSGIQVTALVHQIAKRADTLLRKKPLSHVTKPNQQVNPNKVNKLEEDEEAVAATAAMIARTFSNFNSRSRPDGNYGREQRRSNQQQSYSNTRPQMNHPAQAHCPGCKYLGDQLKLQVRFDHLPASCPRKAAVVNMLKGEDITENNDAQDVNDFISEINKTDDAYKVFQSDAFLTRDKVFHRDISEPNPLPALETPLEIEIVTDPAIPAMDWTKGSYLQIK